jgi:hypothetical protein
MTIDAASEARAVRYLLGTLPEPEQIQVEQELIAIEDELAYAYLRDELNADDRRRFEQRYLSTEDGHRRAEFAATLIRAVALAPAPHAVATRPGKRTIGDLVRAQWLPFAAAAAVMAVVSGWLAVQTVRLQRETARLRAEQSAASRQLEERLAAANAKADQIAGDLARERNRPPTAPVIASVILTPGLTRSAGELPRVSVPSGAGVLRMQLDLAGAEPHPTYRVTIRTAEGNNIWSQDGLRPLPLSAGQALVLEIPSHALPRGDYEVALMAAGPTGRLAQLDTYSFSVRR